jgi:hypothetical protein
VKKIDSDYFEESLSAARIVKRTRKIMADHSNSPGKPKFSAKIIKERLRTIHRGGAEGPK